VTIGIGNVREIVSDTLPKKNAEEYLATKALLARHIQIHHLWNVYRDVKYVEEHISIVEEMRDKGLIHVYMDDLDDTLSGYSPES